MKKIKGFRKKDEERISQRILYVIVALTAVVFMAFYLVGFNEPLASDPAFNAPLLTDVLIGFMWVLLVLAVVAALVAMVKGLRMSNQDEELSNGIPSRKIAYSTYGITILLLVLSFAFGSSKAMMVNGAHFTDAFWLRVTDMFVNTSLSLLVIAAGVVIFGATRYYRKEHQK